MNVYLNGQLYTLYGDQAALVVKDEQRAEAAVQSVVDRFIKDSQTDDSPFDMSGR